MTDIANTLNVTVAREGGDATVLSIAGTALLVLLFVIVALLPFDGAPNSDAIPTFFGP
jgi:hypothetical protein